MTYQGRVRNGVVVLDGKVRLPEGVAVEVVLSEPTPSAAPGEAIPTLYERLKEVVGAVKGLPPDFARNHDYYIHGCPGKWRVRLPIHLP